MSIAIAVLAPVVAALGDRDLWAPDEPRYGQVVREWVEGGGPVVPTLDGEPYAEKPPLLVWAAAVVSWATGGVTSRSVRLTAALFAGLAAWWLARLARRWTGSREAGATAALLFASMALVAWHAPRAAFDLPLACAVVAAVERGAAWLDGGRRGAAVACGAAWAAAVLLKGPMGLVLPPLGLAGAALAGTRRRPWREAGWLWAPAVMAVLVLAWLVPALWLGGEAYGARLLGQVADRTTGAEGHHLRPFWHYAVLWPAVVMPWLPAALVGMGLAVRTLRRPGRARVGAAACLAAGVGGLAVLSVAATKRDLYMIPMLPFFAIPAARLLHALRARPGGHAARATRVVLLGTLGVGVVASLLLPSLGARALLGSLEPGLTHPQAWPVAIAAALVLAVGGAFAARPGCAIAVVARTGGAAILVAWAVVQVGFFPLVDARKSYAGVAQAAVAAAGGGRVHEVGGYLGNFLWSVGRARGERWDATDARTVERVARALSAEAPPAAVVARVRWWREAVEAARASPDGGAALSRIRVVWAGWADRNFLVVLSGAATSRASPP